MHRRAFVAGALASPLLPGRGAAAQPSIPIGDMHFHSFFGESKCHSRPKLAIGNYARVLKAALQPGKA